MPDWFIIGCAVLICLILGYDILYMLNEHDRRKKKINERFVKLTQEKRTDDE